MEESFPSGIRQFTSGSDIRPIPDPTVLTSSLVNAAKEENRRDLAFVREVLEAKIITLESTFAAKIEAIEKATILLQTIQDRLPEAIRLAVHQLEEIMDQRFIATAEQFQSIKVQFHERDVRDERAAATTQEAIKAALEAQKEMWALQNASVAQSMTRIEAANIKQNDTVVTLFQTSNNAQSEKTDDLKQRVTILEGRTAGIAMAKTEQRETTKGDLEGRQYVLAIIFGLFGAVGVIAAIVMSVARP